jgi:heme/copper-type cytochrome/quinol oxidase subunit 2
LKKISDFIPKVSNKAPHTSKSKTGLIVGIVVPVVLLGVLAVLSFLFWRNLKKNKEMEEGTLLYILRT